MQIKSILNLGSITIILISFLLGLTLQKITISTPDQLARKFNCNKIY